MKKRSILALATFATFSLSLQAAPSAVVNGTTIDQNQVQAVMGSNPALARSPQAAEQVVDSLVAQELLAQDARSKNLDKNPQVQARLALANRQVLANAAIEDYLSKHPVTDAELKSAYQEFIKSLGGQEYRARHILVRSDAEASSIMAQLRKGGDFAKLAKSKSIDKGSAQNGGELGWFVPGMMVKPFADAVTGAKKGALVGPVKTEFGNHIIQLEDTRKITPPSFDAVKERLRGELQQREIQKYVEARRAQAKIEAKR